MKNFKLLLATTAILSTGFAMNVNALTGESDTVNVEVELIRARTLDASKLDFGKIVVDSATDEVHILMDSSGVVSVSPTGSPNAYVLSEGSKAVITGAGCSNISYTKDQVALTPPAQSTGLDAHLQSLACTDNTDGNATLHGTVSFNKVGGNIPVGKYTAEFTVTAVYQ